MLTKTLLFGVAMMTMGADAFWRMPCRGVLTNERVDPVDTPDKVAAHVHQVHGGNHFALTTTNADLRASECTSCMVKGDNSAYWYPQLYWEDFSTGKLTLVESSGGALIYYFLRPEDGVTVQPFPENLRMIAGDGTLRSWPWPDQKTNDPRFAAWSEEDKLNEAKKRQHAIGWNCLNGGGPYEDTLGRKFIPQGMKCDYGLRAEIVFPSCWDGKNEDTPDHRSHVAYPTGVESGDCPPGFPIRLPTLLYEVTWNTWPLVSKGNGRLVVATGDPTGYGWHADFMNGWDTELLRAAVNKCTNISGVIEDCEVFTSRGVLQTELEQKSCQKKAKIEVDEEVFGPLSELPGCNPIVEGPERASRGGCTEKDKLLAAKAGLTGKVKEVKQDVKGKVEEVKQDIKGKVEEVKEKHADKAAEKAAEKVEQNPAPAEIYQASVDKEAAPQPDKVVAEKQDPNVVVEWVTETVYVTPAAKAKRHAHGHMH